MRDHDNNYPESVSDPAASGIPEYADDDSTAYDDAPSSREADGPDPTAMPADRDEGPVAVEDFGVTAEQQRSGESLAARLIREEPDIDPSDPPPEPSEGESLSPQTEPSAYDQEAGDEVGRLVSPDQGSGVDREKDEIASDAGASGGGASAEELAMHEVPPDDEGT